MPSLSLVAPAFSGTSLLGNYLADAVWVLIPSSTPCWNDDQVVTKQLFREEGRTVLHRKKGQSPGLLARMFSLSCKLRQGGSPECLPWKSLGTTVTRTKEWAFDSLPTLPKKRGSLLKSSPNGLRAMLRFLRVDQQPRFCIVQDGHFMWFDEEAASTKGQAKGCINFLIHRAQIHLGSTETSFVISPAEPLGWRDPSSFTGDARRSFCFDASDAESCVQWVDALTEHIRFGNMAAEQLGAAWLGGSLQSFRHAPESLVARAVTCLAGLGGM